MQRQSIAVPAKPDAADTAYWDDAFQLARKRIAAKDFAAAEELLRGVYADSKFRSADSPGIALNLGICRHEQGDFAGAISFYEESLASPNWGEVARREIVQSVRAARLGQPARSGGGEPEKPEAADAAYWDDAFQLARKRIAAKDFAAAEELLRGVYADSKFRSADSPGIALNLGICRHEQGDFAGAISFYEESLASPNWGEVARREIVQSVRAARLGQPARSGGGEPEKPEAADAAYWDDAFQLARKRIAAKDFAAAEELRGVYAGSKFRSADSPGIALNLGICRHEQGDFAGAISFYEESLASPNWGEVARREIVQSVRAARLGQPPRTQATTGS